MHGVDVVGLTVGVAVRFDGAIAVVVRRSVDLAVRVPIHAVVEAVGDLGHRRRYARVEGAVGHPHVEVVVHCRARRRHAAEAQVDARHILALPVLIRSVAEAGDGEVARLLRGGHGVDLRYGPPPKIFGVGDPHEVKIHIGVVQDDVAVGIESHAVSLYVRVIGGHGKREGILAEGVTRAIWIAVTTGGYHALVDVPVAVVVHLVADLIGPRMYVFVGVVTVRSRRTARPIAVPVQIRAPLAGGRNVPVDATTIAIAVAVAGLRDGRPTRQSHRRADNDQPQTKALKQCSELHSRIPPKGYI